MARSLENVHRSIKIPQQRWFRRLLAFTGPAYLVSVGYMDPGNWATDIEGGSKFGYRLLWVLLMSNFMAIVLQALSARLGLVTGRDLAQACRDDYPPLVNYLLFVFCEIAIAACDLAEVLGTAIGLNLLFPALPLHWAVVITGGDVLLLLAMQRYGIRNLEAFIVILIATIGLCYVVEIFLCHPSVRAIAAGLVPHYLPPAELYVAIGIIGATVMPHNLYLHSALVQSRDVYRSREAVAEACKFNLIDSAIAMNCAFLVNAAILIVAAATFWHRAEITEFQQAHAMLNNVLGTRIAPVAFALALICAGQSSTVTGTLAGQITMEGFLRFRIRPWLRRLITRAMAIVPAVAVIVSVGDEGAYKLLILSQVVLSLQLSFAVVPLIRFTGSKQKMGPFANR
ncbi:MAG: Nramp family divalent metal transporter, partial [Thermoguttaceae bacterium]